MYEQQIITKIIEDKDIDILERNQLQDQHFVTQKKVIRYILEYEAEYGDIPSKTTITKEFPTFQYADLEESEEFVVDKIKETYLYTELVPIIKNSADLLRKDSNEALKHLKADIEEIYNEATNNTNTGKDIVKNANERLQDYEKRVELKGMLGIPSGIKQLDDITFGWLPEDLVTIFARTSEGKSWITLYLLIQAWLQGKKVLLYSGEMSHLMVGYRIDTYLGHFSNRGLMGGKDFQREEYRKHIQELEQKEGFIVVTPSDLGNKRPTTKDIEKLINIHKPDIVGIDQITLIDDFRRADNTRNRYGNITADLFNISERYQIPILAVTQANREVAKKNEQKENPESPKLHEISESDQIAHNSSRVIALSRVDNILKLNIEKNRYGEDKGEILLNWQIDKGYIKPILEDEKIIENDYGF